MDLFPVPEDHSILASRGTPAHKISIRPLVILCGILAGAAVLGLRWSAPPPPAGGITVIFGEEPRTLDPALASTLLEGKLLPAFLEGLTVPDAETLEPRPGMAERWDISADGKRYEFHLREALWSDGRPVTAEDFRWSWMRVLSTPEAPMWELLAPVRGARSFREKKTPEDAVGLSAPDPRTFVVELDQPTPWFLGLTSTMTFLPVPRPAVETHGRRWTRPGHFVANGPFTLARWEPNFRIVAARNPRYWDTAHVALEGVTFLSVPPGPTQFNLYAGGAASWIADPQPDLVRDLAGRPDLHVSPRLGISFVRLAANHPPFADNRVRRAFSLAIDRRRLTAVNAAGQIPFAAFVPPGFSGYPEPDLPLSDPAAARSLLDAAGFPGGVRFPEVRFLYPSQKEFRVVAETLQAIWQDELGVTVRMDRVDRKEWARRMREVDYDLCLSSWIGDYRDPNSFLEIFLSGSGNNRTGWSDAEYDGLVRRAAGESGEVRLATLAAAERRLLEEGPAAPLYVPVTIELWDPRLKGIRENALGVHPLKGVGR